MSQPAQGQEPAAGEDLFQFGERAKAAASAAPAPGPAPEALLPMGAVDDTLDDTLTGDLEAQAPFEEYAPRAGLPPIVVPLLLVMAVANLALVGLTWRSLRREQPPGAPAEAEHGPARMPAGEEHADAGEHRAEERGLGLEQLVGSRDEAWAGLDDAERALDAGDYVAARRELYGLLTVLDRVALAERPDVEARAGFLIAESYRLQARSLVAAAEEAP